MSGRKRQVTRQSFITDLHPIEGADDLMLTIPDEILASEDWRVGDVLKVEARPGKIILTNRSKLERTPVDPNVG